CGIERQLGVGERLWLLFPGQRDERRNAAFDFAGDLEDAGVRIGAVDHNGWRCQRDCSALGGEPCSVAGYRQLAVTDLQARLAVNGDRGERAEAGDLDTC